MKNAKMYFKTTLNCGGCVSKVQADLDKLAGKDKWEVALDNSDKILTVYNQDVNPSEVIELIRSKGFSAEEVKVE